MLSNIHLIHIAYLWPSQKIKKYGKFSAEHNILSLLKILTDYMDGSSLIFKISIVPFYDYKI